MTKKELESHTIMELRSLAGRSDVPLRRSWTKSEIVAAILRTTSPKRGRKPKPVVVKPPKPEENARKKTKAAAVARKAVEIQRESVAQPVAPKSRRAAAISRKPSNSRKTADFQSVSVAVPNPQTASQMPTASPRPSIVNNLTALMARDPHTLFVYWELKDSIPCEGLSLRLHDLSSRDRHGVSDCYEYPVSCRTGGRYLFLRLPGRRFVCEMVSSAHGRHVVLARSGEIETPTDRMTVPARTDAARLYETVFGAQAGAETGYEIGVVDILSPSSRIF
jgi:hypothetical protein